MSSVLKFFKSDKKKKGGQYLEISEIGMPTQVPTVFHVLFLYQPICLYGYISLSLSLSLSLCISFFFCPLFASPLLLAVLSLSLSNSAIGQMTNFRYRTIFPGAWTRTAVLPASRSRGASAFSSWSRPRRQRTRRTRRRPNRFSSGSTRDKRM